MRFAAFFAAIFSATVGWAGELMIPKTCGQAVVVTTPNWASPGGTLQRWSRSDAQTSWQKVGAPVAVVIGEHGLGWGLGLHRVPDDGAPRKAEGDRRAPAGVFRLTGVFGRAAQADSRLPWQSITPTLEAVDDPASRFYNRIVDRVRVARPDWHSSERMAAIPDYALGIVVAHNPQNIRGAGSCIFLHLWLGNRPGTAGCTVLHERDLVTLVRWLDPAREPVLIQLPREVARRELDGF
jgi:D-alanyl-D-alanine dipeptidase